MTAGEYIPGLLRLAAIVVPTWTAGRALRRTMLTGIDRPAAALADALLALSLLLTAAEALGVLGLLRAPELIAASWLAAAACLTLERRVAGPRDVGNHRTARARAGAATSATTTAAAKRSPWSTAAALAAVAAAATQWAVQSADSLGSGMPSFDTLWYHMPFAARFAQTGSVTAIQFTQADPFVAYYPANSELLHAVGLLVLHGDLLSPLLNLGWLALALLAGWRIGRRWNAEVATLTSVAVLASLPVLASTQPGEAFNDIGGLACLLAAVPFALEARGDARMLALAGLALGLAAGTKLNFLVPVAALLAGVVLLAPAGRRRRALTVCGLATAATGGWWYLRNLIAVGNPLGLSLHLGPLRLPGPGSPLAAVSQQTVASELGHTALWSSRFAPGLEHAFGALWPVLVALCLLAFVLAALRRGERGTSVLAAVATVTGASYLFLPTGAAGIAQGTTEFQVNLRYLTPAIALALVLLCVHLHRRARAAVGATLLAIALIAQLQGSLWPAQPARHLVFALATAGVAAGGWAALRTLRRRPSLRLPGACAAVAVLALAGYAVQRHYYAGRYLRGESSDPALGAVDRWAQSVAHARIALYGSVQQYPLYGARDTNTVDYLGAREGNGGFAPIASCRAWREALGDGHYDYVVLTPPPTAAIPEAWTAADPGASAVLRPAPGYVVYALPAAPTGGTC